MPGPSHIATGSHGLPSSMRRRRFDAPAAGRRVAGLLLAACMLIGDVTWAAPRDGSVMRFPSGATFQLELAIDPATREMGYMFRPHVPDDEGMLFFFEQPGHHGFWMKNCLVALDLIWLDKQLRVVHIAENVPPCPPEGSCPLIRPMQQAHFVLEVAAGRAAEERLSVGDQLVRERPKETP